MSRQRRFLLAIWEGGGTVPPELGVATRLAAAGNEIAVIGDPTLSDRVTALGFEFTPWVRPPHRNTLERDDDVFKDWELSNPLAMLRNARDRYMAGPASDFADETSAAIAQWDPDAVLVDSLILGAMVGAQGAGLPVGALIPNIWMVPTPGMTPVGPGFAPAKTVVGRTRDALVRGMANRIFDGGLDAINRARRSHGLAPLDHFWDQLRSCDRLFVLSSRTFDTGSAHVPEHALYVGPILDDPAWAGPLEIDWSDPSKPLVLVSLSSTYQDQESLLTRIVDALSGSSFRALVTLGQMIDPAAVTSDDPDVVVVPAAAHGPHLAEAIAVVTHCGHGTAIKALASGTPMVCIPMGRDQIDTAIRVTQAGAGVRITTKAAPSRILAAVHEIVEDDRYRRAAELMAKEIARERNAVDLVAEVGSLVENTPSASGRTRS